MPVTPHAPLDAVVVGAGLNGLAAAITLARAGRSVRVYEAQPAAGGSVRSEELTVPGYVHDVGATVVSLTSLSPLLRTLPLAEHGLEFVHPETPFAHPLDDGSAAVLERSVSVTADGLGARDAPVYCHLMASLVDRADSLMDALLRPLGLRHPLLMARFGVHAIQPVTRVADRLFESPQAHALLAGPAAHSMLSLDSLATTGYALGLMIGAHAAGWPVARGGAGAVTRAMVACLEALGGEVVTSTRVTALDELPPSRAVLCDVTPRQLLRMAGKRLPTLYRWRLSRYRYGPGVFKMDWALNAPVPWTAHACRRAGTVHVGGTMADIAVSERDVVNGRHPERPFVLAVQPSVFDSTRAPAGKHTLWAYCHVPSASSFDMQQRMEDQIERFAPGFRDCIVASHRMTPADLEGWNENIIGGDIAGGAGNFGQIIGRPLLSLHPYSTPLPGVFLCSSSTPPGVGVHGMCGYHAAQRALDTVLR